MLASDAFYQRTNRKYLFNIQAIENIPSIIQYGILCHRDANRYEHISIALQDVQNKRSTAAVPNGLKLHQYANLYFDYYNPMLSRVRDRNCEICVLAVDYRVLNTEGCILADRNAAADIVRFLEPVSGINEIKFDMVYAKSWNHTDEYEYRNHKAIKCAEALIPGKVPYAFISGAMVIDEDAKEKMAHLGFEKQIYVRPESFF